MLLIFLNRKAAPVVVVSKAVFVMDSKKQLVIIGGGFAGLSVARFVDKSQWDVILVDRNNFHTFPPLFYQIASSGLEPASICFPFRRELRGRHYRGCQFRMGEVKIIDTDAQTVQTQHETLHYDTLVVAAGSKRDFLGHDYLEKSVYTLKSTSEAIRCRNEVIDRLERAAICRDAAERACLLTFVVVGGGPSGVEIAGALGELKRFIIKREYPTLSPDEMKVILVEGADVLLHTMSRKSSCDARKGLRQLCVDVRTGITLKNYEDGVLTFSDGSTIVSDTVIWTAGITGVHFDVKGRRPETGAGNRWIVDEYNQVKGLDNVYAIGDISLMTLPDYPKGHPQQAQVALQQGKLLGLNLNRPQNERSPFVYKNKGAMATIGRNRAVVDLRRGNGVHLNGRTAWFTWLFVHFISLLGMRNRAVVFINWMWNYFTYTSSLRLLLRPDRYPLRKYWKDET